MRRNKRIESMLDQAEKNGECLPCRDNPAYRALQRRASRNELLSPYPCVFVRQEFWNGLDPSRQDLALVKALSILHENWTFTGVSAANIHGLDHSHALHRRHNIYIVSTSGNSTGQHDKLKRLYIRKPHVIAIQGVKVTDIPQTLISMALTHSFCEALPVFDAAARSGTTKSDILKACKNMRVDKTDINRLISLMNPLSENSGESLARATMIELGFVVPRLQVPFRNPDPNHQPYRADFTWQLPGNRCVVAEYDGMQKYVMQSGFSRSTIENKVHEQLRRETDLKAQGADLIVRFQYEDLLHPQRLEAKLDAAGIPKRT
ncbi:hypothetical protein [Bifidobacterium sp. ESL0704]|uniref:hypothetical protein n=1 Tax=Bifidobacterium sp. ESL0704 TaxID=2983219 RepID=UPI0023F9A22E|nr:hypothetical protein [Bifidobacterium sp. ESL0704]WEV52352.1 hypothetical protein OZX64_05455 [Bifidobacterium sp. ESL0704]